MKARITLDTRRAKRDGSYPVVIEVRNKDKVRIGTPYSAVLDNWDVGSFNKNESNYKRKNVVLQDLLNRVERFLLGLDESQARMDDRRLRQELGKIVKGDCGKTDKCFADYIDEFMGTKDKKSTIELYAMTRKKVVAYDPKCTFETMDRRWLSGFARWMEEGGMKVNACGIHLRNIRAVFNYCIDEEYTTLYPFRKFTIEKEETRKRSLTVEQLRMLRDYPCEEHQRRYRDMFMLMFYLIGINAADLFLARPGGVVNGRLEYRRAKTGKLYSVRIEPEAQEVLDRYRGREFLLDVMDEYGNYKDFLHRMNLNLRQIGEFKRAGLGGKKVRTPLFPELSSYWSRHTWATLAAQIDVPKDIISEALGHEYGCSTTSIYINFNRGKVDMANRAVIDFLNG